MYFDVLKSVELFLYICNVHGDFVLFKISPKTAQISEHLNTRNDFLTYPRHISFRIMGYSRQP